MSKTNDFLGFEIISKLGEGAFSTTYLARKDNRTVAIKIIEIPNPQTRKELTKDEMQGLNFQNSLRKTSAQLNDVLRTLVATNDRKGILRYYDYHISVDPKNHTYQLGILTEHLENINDYVRKNDMRVRQVLKMGMDLCDGLQRLSSLGIYHGNIKESNIFYDKIRGFKLGDFFFNDILIQTLKPADTYSDYGYRFLAPEAYDSKPYSYETDMFTLSILLYKLLNNGSLPYDVESINMSVKEIRARFIESRTLPETPFIEQPILDVLNKAAAFDPDDRYSDFLEFKLALRESMGKIEISNLDRIITPNTISTNYIPIPTPEKTDEDIKDTVDEIHKKLDENQKKTHTIETGVPFTISLGKDKPLPQMLDPESGETKSLVPPKITGRKKKKPIDKLGKTGQQEPVLELGNKKNTGSIQIPPVRDLTKDPVFTTTKAPLSYEPGPYESQILEEMTAELEKISFDYDEDQKFDYNYSEDELEEQSVKSHISTAIFFFSLILIVILFVVLFPYIQEFFKGLKK